MQIVPLMLGVNQPSYSREIPIKIIGCVSFRNELHLGKNKFRLSEIFTSSFC